MEFDESIWILVKEDESGGMVVPLKRINLTKTNEKVTEVARDGSSCSRDVTTC